MELTPYIYKLLPRFADTGSFGLLEGTYELAYFEKGPRRFSLEDGIRYNLTMSNTSGAVLIMGTVAAIVKTDCDRCLEPAQLEVTGEVEAYVVFDATRLEAPSDEDEYVIAKGPDGRIDLAPMLFSALILALPPMVLCSEDCAGICPSCGAYLNYEPCSCVDGQVDNDHPFAALKDLL